MNLTKRHEACSALASFHTDSFAATYGVCPEDLVLDWNMWYDQYNMLDDKELDIEVYKMHTAIEFMAKHLSSHNFGWDEPRAKSVYEEII